MVRKTPPMMAPDRLVVGQRLTSSLLLSLPSALAVMHETGL